MKKITLIILLILLLISCKSKVSDVKQQLEGITPTIQILSPEENQFFDAEAPVNLELLVTDFSFDENSTESNKGYARLTLDDETIILNQKTHTFKNFKPGTHTLLVELFHSTNISYDVSKGVVFKVKPKEAVLNILSPKNNYLTNKTTVDVKVSVENLDLNLDGYILLTLNNNVQVINSLDYKFTDLNPGDYILKVEPYRNDRSSAGAEKSVSFKVEGIPPEGLGFDIWWPRENANIEGSLAALRLVLSDKFKLGKENSSNVENEGHFHISVNNEKLIEVYEATTTIKNLLAGKNTITVEMVQNDHTSYNLKKTITFNAQVVTSKN